MLIMGTGDTNRKRKIIIFNSERQSAADLPQAKPGRVQWWLGDALLLAKNAVTDHNSPNSACSYPELRSESSTDDNVKNRAYWIHWIGLRCISFLPRAILLVFKYFFV